MKAATALIDTNALNHNLQVVRTFAPHSLIWSIVKANAYGHGLLPIAKALSSQTYGFGVARLDEALALRQAGVKNPILLLEGFFAADVLPVLAKYDLQTVVHNQEQLIALEKAKLSAPITVWLKIDTGMHRLGVRAEHFEAYHQRLNECVNVTKPLHFMSHFGCADELDNPLTSQQISSFEQMVGNTEGNKSLAASSGCLLWQGSHYDAVRPGIALYGVSPIGDRTGADFGLKPVMTMTSSLIAVRDAKKGEAIGYAGRWSTDRDTKIGVVAIGYGDGYPGTAPDGTPVLINGRCVPLAGRVSMDMLTVDLGPDAIDKMGDEVILWGKDLPVEKVASHIGTIGYELVTNITSRVELSYDMP